MRRRDERGLTLGELVVVLLIIGILMAIAIPVWFVVLRGTAATEAQSTARAALAEADSVFAASGGWYGQNFFNGDFASLMQQQDPGMSWYRHTWKGPGTAPSDAVSVQVFDGGESVVLAARGGGKCWELAKVNTSGSASGLAVGTHYAWAPASPHGCAVAPPTSSSGWASSWAQAEQQYPQGGGSWWSGGDQ